VKPRKTAAGNNAKPAWTWKVSGLEAGEVAAVFLDEFGARRRQAAEAILDNITARTKTCACCGEAFLARRSFAEVCSRPCRDKLSHQAATVRYNQLRARGMAPAEARRHRHSPHAVMTVASAVPQTRMAL
jgi:hypothetical protein